MKVRAAETQALARRTDQPSAASGAFAVRLRGRDWSLSVGNGLPIRVSVPLGANSQSAVNTERRKLSKLLGQESADLTFLLTSVRTRLNPDSMKLLRPSLAGQLDASLTTYAFKGGSWMIPC